MKIRPAYSQSGLNIKRFSAKLQTSEDLELNMEEKEWWLNLEKET